MKIVSSAFEDRAKIPAKYSCEGVDVSPPLSFQDIPEGTQSLALIVEDPDAPNGTFDHWIVWNLPPDVKGLSEGAKVPRQGTNHFGDVRYRGPCPPKGKAHRYYFKLYALEVMLDLPQGATKEELEDAIEGLMLDEAEIVGTYQRT